jgi:hypothetical protein
MAGAPGDAQDAFDELMERLVHDVLTTRGDAEPSTRRAAFDAAAALAGRDIRPAPDAPGVPAELASFVDTIARHAYRVTDRMVRDLLASGCSEDALFEVILAVATGAGAARLELGTRAVREAAGATG